MSAATLKPSGLPDADTPRKSNGSASSEWYKGYVCGAFSGVAKTTVGHPFDTIKVRLQTAGPSHFKGPLDCVLQTLRNEGVAGIFKGATPPMIGWIFMDSIMLGSLNVYRRLLNDSLFNPRPRLGTEEQGKLPVIGHAMAGTMAGWTVSFFAGPVEHIKARLQVQYAAEKSKRLYSGPIDCIRKIRRQHGIRCIYHGLYATLIFRSFFCFWWGSYDIIRERLKKHTNMRPWAITFWAGGLSAQLFWFTSYPSDVVKQRVLTDPLGPERQFPRWRDAAKAVWRERGWRGYWRGFAPCFLRAFPANAAALVAYETAWTAFYGGH